MTRTPLHRAGALFLAAVLASAPTLTLAHDRDSREMKEKFKPKKSPFRNIPITGTIEGAPFAGTLDVTGFTSVKETVGDQLVNRVYAVGILNAPGHSPMPVWMPLVGGGSSAGLARATAAAPGAIVAQQAISCDILNLVLGPLDLNLLGLEVHLNQVILDIVAQTGAGNLLGNLLCAVVGLLDGLDLAGLLSDVLTNVLTNLLNNLVGLP